MSLSGNRHLRLLTLGTSGKLVYANGLGTSSWRQMARAVKSFTSRCRDTLVVLRVAGCHQIECLLPYR